MCICAKGKIFEWAQLLLISKRPLGGGGCDFMSGFVEQIEKLRAGMSPVSAPEVEESSQIKDLEEVEATLMEIGVHPGRAGTTTPVWFGPRI